MGVSRWRRLHDDQNGIALIMVIGIGAVLMVLVATALAYSVGGVRKVTPSPIAAKASLALFDGFLALSAMLAGSR